MFSSNDTTYPNGALQEQVIGNLPDWGPACITDLLDTLTSIETPFPCTFAVSGAKKSSLRFGFVENLYDRRRWAVLPGILREYLDVCRGIAPETSLVVFFKGGETVDELADYYARFWGILQFLHEQDTESWPSGVSTSPDEASWEFSFGGQSIFVVCNTPAHLRRKSRANSTFMITFQPRWVFDGLGGDTPRGTAARRVIRKRLRAFDDVLPSPELGDYGDPDNREWRQYFLGEDNETTAATCPFQHK
jgi:hypothetical protein